MATEIHEENDGAEELFEHHRLVADAGQQPLRVDKFVSNLISKMSPNTISMSYRESCYFRFFWSFPAEIITNIITLFYNMNLTDC